MNSRIYINARFLTQRLTGVQRFAYEISKNLSVILKDRVVLIAPKSSKILSCYKHDFIIPFVSSVDPSLTIIISSIYSTWYFILY